MRTITNIFGLPSSMYRALAADTYKSTGDISITRLIAPPRIVSLRKKNEDSIIEDASQRVWSLLGQASHLVMERAAEPGTIVEKRLEMVIDGMKNDETGEVWKWTLSGQPDIYEEETLSDYKVTSVFAFLMGEKPEWTHQLNMQAMLHRHAGDTVKKIRIIAILRDWSRRKAQLEREYPSCPVMVVEFPLWSFEEQVKYAEERIRLHQSAWRDYVKSGHDESKLPMCSDEERWYRGSKFAVTKVGNKKADRLFDTKEQAEKFRIEQTPNLPKGKTYQPVIERPGENVRCMDYCDVSNFCAFGKKLKEEENAE